jgi:N-acyl-D-aspartate/D-glutamate deacylase
MPEYDVIIRSGTLVDGTGMPRRRADVGIRNGRIAALGRLGEASARQIVDAEGMIVAPGFIDLHTHYDAQIFWDPHLSLSGWHGVTSVVIGNCGFGFAPVAPEMRDRSMLGMTRNEAISYEAMKEGMPWDWVTFPEFLDSLARTPKAINLLPYVPLTPLLVWVMGLERAKAGELPTDAEHAEMARLLHEAMDAGACGWSAQRTPPSGFGDTQRDYDGTPMPTDVMHQETCRVLARVLAERNEGFIQMTLTSGDHEGDHKAFEELAELSGRPLLYNILVAVEMAPESHKDTIRWLDDCRERGLSIYAQAMTTNAGFVFNIDQFNQFDDSTPWREALMGTREEIAANIADPSRREKLKAEFPVVATKGILETKVLHAATSENERFEGMRITEIGEALGKHPIDAMLDIAVEEKLDTVFSLDPVTASPTELIREVIEYPWAIPGTSDGGAHTKFFTTGRYPTEFLTRFVRDNDFVSLEHAHWRLSALPAMCAGFRDRGTLREGAPADVVVYDLDALAIEPVETVHDLPGGDWRRVQRARGYRAVLVNGELTLANDREVEATSGRLLRHGGDLPTA